jgi:hypothetical protein
MWHVGRCFGKARQEGSQTSLIREYAKLRSSDYIERSIVTICVTACFLIITVWLIVFRWIRRLVEIVASRSL